MKLLRGKKIADKILKDLKSKIKKEKLKPALAVVLVGEDKASQIYVNLKKKAARKIGVEFYLFKYGKNISENEIIKKIKELNADKKIDGIIVQLPLPKKLSVQKIISAIDPKKDADGFSVKSSAVPVFPKAIIKTLEAVPRAKLLENKKWAIITNSEKFGKVMQTALKREKIKAEYILYKNYKKSLSIIKQADGIISAVGKPNLIKGDMIRNGVIVVDGGITKKDKKVLGDADFKSVKNKASYITPVPGGVGPVTIACLLENVYLLSKNIH